MHVSKEIKKVNNFAQNSNKANLVQLKNEDFVTIISELHGRMVIEFIWLLPIIQIISDLILVPHFIYAITNHYSKLMQM